MRLGKTTQFPSVASRIFVSSTRSTAVLSNCVLSSRVSFYRSYQAPVDGPFMPSVLPLALPSGYTASHDVSWKLNNQSRWLLLPRNSSVHGFEKLCLHQSSLPIFTLCLFRHGIHAGSSVDLSIDDVRKLRVNPYLRTVCTAMKLGVCLSSSPLTND